jgi:hypothetical protein
MGVVTIKLHGIQEKILNKIISSGIAETQNEAIRMALIHFALEMKIINDKMLLEVMREDLSKDRSTAEEVLAEIERVKDESISR